MLHSLRNFWRIGLLATAAIATSACVVDPGYGYYDRATTAPLLPFT